MRTFEVRNGMGDVKMMVRAETERQALEIGASQSGLEPTEDLFESCAARESPVERSAQKHKAAQQKFKRPTLPPRPMFRER